MKKSKGVAILLAVLLVLAGLSYYASIILSSTGKGEDKNIKLGLDLPVVSASLIRQKTRILPQKI